MLVYINKMLAADSLVFTGV